MEEKSTIESLVTSAAVSSVITFSLTYFLLNRQKHRFKKELEEIKRRNLIEIENVKNDHKKNLDIDKRITDARLSYYEHLGELCYRAKNLSKYCLSNLKSEEIDDLSNVISEIKETLYKGSIHLKKDNTFKEIHAFKNLLDTYALKLNNSPDKFELEKDLDVILIAFQNVDSEIVKKYLK